MLKTLEQTAQTCINAVHLIDIDENEIELLQSDRWKHGDLPPETISWLIELHDQVVEAINYEQASLCGQIYDCGKDGNLTHEEIFGLDCLGLSKEISQSSEIRGGKGNE